MSTEQSIASQLVSCPVGCAFLLTLQRDQVPVALAVTPHQIFARLATASRAVDPWSPIFEREVAAVLSRGTHLLSLAHEVVAHPGSQWWTAPMDRTRQVLVVDNPPTQVPCLKSASGWEAYAERPKGWRVTSTLSEGYSCLDAVVASGVGDWPSPSEQSRFKAEIDDSARVLEIVTAADWHALCISYPRTNQWSSSPAGVGTLTPDWDRVATRWEGIHLTLLALFTVPFVPYNSEAGTTMMWSWNTEGTLWLPGGLLRAGAPLPPLRCNPNTESQDITPLMSADLGLHNYAPTNASILRASWRWWGRLSRIFTRSL